MVAAPFSLSPALLLACVGFAAIVAAQLVLLVAAGRLLAGRQRRLAALPLPPDLPDEALLDLMALG